MAVGKLTKKSIEELPIGATLWDTQVRGLGIRKLKTCATFVLKTNIHREQRMIKIGQFGRPWTVEKARKECFRILGNIASGDEPQKPTESLTVSGLTNVYLERNAKKRLKSNSINLYNVIFDKHINPAIGKRSAHALTKNDVAKLHSRLSVSTPVMANRAIHTLAAVFNWGIKQGLVDKNPVVGIEKNKEKKRERYLSSDEFKRLGDSLRKHDTAHPSAVSAIKMLILTGCRLREVLNLQWRHVDLDRGALFLPDSKSGAKMIVLSKDAVRVIEGIPKLSEYLFPGRDLTSHRADLKRPWARITKDANLDGLRLHDLRHSYASIGAGLSISLPIIGKLLGHTQVRTTERYAHLAVDPLRLATDQIGGRISDALNGDE